MASDSCGGHASITIPPDEPNIFLNNYLLDLKGNVKLAGVTSITTKWHHSRYNCISVPSKLYQVCPGSYRDYMLGNKGISIWMLNKVFSFNVGFIDEIFSAFTYCYVGKHRIRLPKSINPQLAYVIGYLHGDGFVERNKKRVAFFDHYKSQLELVNALFESLFGVTGSIYKRKNEDVYCLYVGSVALNSFFADVMGVGRGRRDINEIPEQILENNELLRWYLCGLFDAESSMPLNPIKKRDIYIDIAMKDLRLIETVWHLLSQRFGIMAYGPYKRKVKIYKKLQINPELELRIRKASEITKFLTEIGCLHPDKVRRKSIILRLLGP